MNLGRKEFGIQPSCVRSPCPSLKYSAFDAMSRSKVPLRFFDQVEFIGVYTLFYKTMLKFSYYIFILRIVFLFRTMKMSRKYFTHFFYSGQSFVIRFGTFQNQYRLFISLNQGEKIDLVNSLFNSLVPIKQTQFNCFA